MPKLITDFQKAAAGMAEGMAALGANAGARLYVPAFDRARWGGKENNCYNFALDRCTGDYLQPGSITDKDHLLNYMWFKNLAHLVSEVSAGAKRDGLVFLGQNFARAVGDCLDDHGLSALFYRELQGMGRGNVAVDYHWLALRRDGYGSHVWAHKDGDAPAALCCPDAGAVDPTGMTDAAAASQYRYFQGFFAVPRQLAMTA